MNQQPLTPEEASEFITLLLDLYPQQNASVNNAEFIKTQVRTHIERMNFLGFEELHRRYVLVRNLNYTEAGRTELKFFADALKFSLSDKNSINKVRKKYIVQGSELDTLPHQPDSLLELRKLQSEIDPNSQAAAEGIQSLQDLSKIAG